MQRILIDGRYDLVELLGGGGMARVYLARDRVLRRDVALKVLRDQYAENEEFVERFRREAQSAASLSHPNIVPVYDWGRTEDGTYYMTMEHVPNGTLKELIEEEGPLEPGEAADIAGRIADALSVAHEMGVIHRDIKPQNVLLSGSSEPKVTDFGIARAASAASISGTSLVLGTATYMSPEQAMGEAADGRSDLYSLGVVLYEMLTGISPFESETPVAAAMKHVNETPRPPIKENPAVSEGLNAVAMKLLSKSPNDRYASATELAEDLSRVRQGLAPTFTNAQATQVPANRTGADDRLGANRGPPGRRRRSLLALMAAVALLALLGAGWSLLRVSDHAAARGQVEVPNVKGLQTSAAQEKLAEAGLTLGEQSETPSDTVSKGSVVEQDPVAGEEVEKSSSVGVKLSSGPEQVTIPDVTGDSIEGASQSLSEAGFTVAGTTEETSDEPAGTVIRTDPSAGARADKGSSVTLILSGGPAKTQDRSAATSRATSSSAGTSAPVPAPVAPAPAPVAPAPVAPTTPARAASTIAPSTLAPAPSPETRKGNNNGDRGQGDNKSQGDNKKGSEN
jgi:serine/threonine-protein kinase